MDFGVDSNVVVEEEDGRRWPFLRVRSWDRSEKDAMDDGSRDLVDIDGLEADPVLFEAPFVSSEGEGPACTRSKDREDDRPRGDAARRSVADLSQNTDFRLQRPSQTESTHQHESDPTAVSGREVGLQRHGGPPPH